MISYFLTTGLITGLMLAVLGAVMVFILPLPDRAKLALVWASKLDTTDMHPVMAFFARCGHYAHEWFIFLSHCMLAGGLYWFMGVSVTAHIAVITYELLWLGVVIPVFLKPTLSGAKLPKIGARPAGFVPIGQELGKHRARVSLDDQIAQLKAQLGEH